MADNKRIAAIAAALAYIEAESAGTAAAGVPQRGIPERVGAGSRSVTSPWGLYGRQRIMNMRALMQRRPSSRRV